MGIFRCTASPTNYYHRVKIKPDDYYLLTETSRTCNGGWSRAQLNYSFNENKIDGKQIMNCSRSMNASCLFASIISLCRVGTEPKWHVSVLLFMSAFQDMVHRGEGPRRYSSHFPNQMFHLNDLSRCGLSGVSIIMGVHVATC